MIYASSNILPLTDLLVHNFETYSNRCTLQYLTDLLYVPSLCPGNLGRVDHVSEFEFDLFIRPDTCNPRFRVWFNFTVENVRETQVSPDTQKYEHTCVVYVNTCGQDYPTVCISRSTLRGTLKSSLLHLPSH